MILSTPIKIAIAASLLSVASIAIWFARRQNLAPRLGGAISRPKQLWLAYAIYVWFFLSPLLALETSLHGSVRVVLGSFGALMWIRGIAELVMMYGTKSWRPPYGIAHDVLCIVVLVALSLVYRRGFDPWSAAFVAFLIMSLLFETYYALSFFRAVEGNTTGEEGVWFASEDDPRFRKINRVTRIGNSILCTFLAAYLLAAFLQ